MGDNYSDSPDETGTLALTEGEVLETDILALTVNNRLGDVVDKVV